MPELPEVEQVRISLLPHIKGKRICKTEVRLPRMIKHPSVQEFMAGVEGKRVTDITRKGKYLTLMLDDGRYIMVHLRMTGALLILPRDLQDPPFAKIRFSLTGGLNLWFTDIRTFGTLSLCGGSDPWQDKGYAGLGPEPLSQEFTEEYLKEKLHFSGRLIARMKYRKDGILLNGVRCRTTAVLTDGDRLRLSVRDPESSSVIWMRPEVILELNILYEDADLLVIFKPEGMVCHPSFGHFRDSLANHAACYLGWEGTSRELHLIGRLDRDTCGLVTVAKNAQAAADLFRQQKCIKKQAQVRTYECVRTYACLFLSGCSTESV